MIHPPLQVVDENDNPIGIASRDEVIEKGQFHRIVRIMLSNSKGQILLQKRSKHVFFPGLWDHSAAGHVDGGEAYLEAAEREMFEEIGVEGIELKEVDYYKSQEIIEEIKLNRFNKLYKGQIDFTPNNINGEEISEVRWFTIDEVKDMIRKHPEQATTSLAYVMERYYD